MLKIRSFLHLIKNYVINRTKKLFQSYSRHMAVTAYAMSIVLFVFYFGNLAGFRTGISEFKADAATYEQSYTEIEETITPGAGASDNTEYTLNSPDTNILFHTTETVDAITVDHQNESTENPLSISPEAINLHEIAASMAILINHNDLLLTNDIINGQADLLGLTRQDDSVKNLVLETAQAPKDTKKNPPAATKKENKKDQAASETMAEISVPANLSLTMNKAMMKKLSDKEMEVLWRIVEAEATGEDIYGKILVANVVLNRVNDKEFPNTVSKVVFQKKGSVSQFSPTKDGRYYSVKITKETKEAVKRALQGEDYSKGALYFFARKLTSKRKASWFDNSLKKVVQHGCHEFYTNK